MIGIYYLKRDDEIIYIGKSVDIDRRIREHEKSSKEFDSWTFIECDELELDKIEFNEIRKHKPIDNVRYLELGRSDVFSDKAKFKSVKIASDLWKEIKQLALDEETTMIDIVAKSFKLYKDK